MAGSQPDEIDWDNMTNKELHDKFQQMMSGQVEDVLNRFEEAMEKIDDIEKAFETKLDNKFNELHTRLPLPAAPVAPLQQQHRLPNQVGRAQHVPIEPGQISSAAVPTIGASVAPPSTVEVEDHYEDEVDQNKNYMQPPAPPPLGRPHAYHRNGMVAPPPEVKLNIPPFEGRYVPDISYLGVRN